MAKSRRGGRRKLGRPRKSPLQIPDMLHGSLGNVVKYAAIGSLVVDAVRESGLLVEQSDGGVVEPKPRRKYTRRKYTRRKPTTPEAVPAAPAEKPKPPRKKKSRRKAAKKQDKSTTSSRQPVTVE